jgi:CubicO group peptidase (beta-lactamase class C family)
MANALPSLVGGGAADGAGRHARLGPPVIGMGPVRPLVPEETALVSPAGGIRASVADAVPWLETLLGQGERRDGRRLWSRAQAAEMWKAQTIIASGPGPSGDAPQRPVLEAYALGWGVTDYRGRRLITHGGLVAGQATRTALLPEEGIAVAIYTNSSEADAVSAMRYAVLDFLIDAPQFNWLGAAIEQQSKNRREVEMALADQDLRKPDDQLSLPLEHYAGRYRDAWYGDVIIQHKEGRLDIVFVPTPAFTGGLEPIGNDRFRTRFASELSEDAVLQFAVRDGQVERLTMQALSPIADFSFDFHHLDLFPVDA